MKCCNKEQLTPFCAFCGKELLTRLAPVGDGALVPIYGYVRASRDKQVMSPEMQEDLIRKKAVTIENGVLVHCRSDRGISATKTRWNDHQRRPEFGKLMREMEPGSHLIIWRLDRLERSAFGMVHALEWLVNRGVNVHVLEHGGMVLDLDKPMGRLLVMVLAGFAGFFADQLGEAVRSAKAYRREHGLSADRYPGLGKIRKKSRRRGKEIKIDSWDRKQCDLIQEIKRRFDSGQRMREIIRDFAARDERMWDGKPWAKRNRKLYCGRKKRSIPEWYEDRWYRVYWQYTELLASGRDLMDLEVSPETQAIAQRQLARKRVGHNGRQRFETMARENEDGVIPSQPTREYEKFTRIDP